MNQSIFRASKSKLHHYGVYPAPSSARPFYDPKSEDDVKDCFSVLGIGPPFPFVIPSFDVLSVELKPLRIHGATPQGEEHTYDGFIRNDPSLSHSLPAWMTVMDSTIVDVSIGGLLKGGGGLMGRWLDV
jgi:hypothetical protein